jgi:hypothetical protein
VIFSPAMNPERGTPGGAQGGRMDLFSVALARVAGAKVDHQRSGPVVGVRGRVVDTSAFEEEQAGPFVVQPAALDPVLEATLV